MNNTKARKTEGFARFCFWFDEVFYVQEERSQYDWVRENADSFLKLVSVKNPSSESNIINEKRVSENKVIISTQSWEKAFLFGLIPGEETTISLCILNDNGYSTD